MVMIKKEALKASQAVEKIDSLFHFFLKLSISPFYNKEKPSKRTVSVHVLHKEFFPERS
ncbi:hypothetical protein BGLY_1412 [Bacillus glycinifermentans]|nr:hypothetical protein BGLY_1412 [Bacillus glycinifermentans]